MIDRGLKLSKELLPLMTKELKNTQRTQITSQTHSKSSALAMRTPYQPARTMDNWTINVISETKKNGYDAEPGRSHSAL